MKKLVILTLAIILLAGMALSEVAPTDEELKALDEYRATLFGTLAPDDYALSVSSELFGYSTRIDAIEAAVYGAMNAQSVSFELLSSIDMDCDAVDNELDRCEDAVEASFRAKTIEHDMYKLLDAEIERLEDRLDNIEDILEDHFHYDD